MMAKKKQGKPKNGVGIPVYKPKPKPRSK